MTTKKQLLDAQKEFTDEVTPALEETIMETLRTQGPGNTLVWFGVVAGSFVICLGLLVLVAGP